MNDTPIEDDWDRLSPCLIRWPTALYSIGFPGADANMWDFLDRWTDPTECWYKWMSYMPAIDIESSFHVLQELAEPFENPIDDWEKHYATDEAWMRVVDWGVVKPVPLKDLQLVFGKKDWFIPSSTSSMETLSY